MQTLVWKLHHGNFGKVMRKYAEKPAVTSIIKTLHIRTHTHRQTYKVQQKDRRKQKKVCQVAQGDSKNIFNNSL